MYAHTRQQSFDAWINQDPANNSELFSTTDKVKNDDPDRVFQNTRGVLAHRMKKMGGWETTATAMESVSR